MRKIAGSKGKVLLDASFYKLKDIFRKISDNDCGELVFLFPPLSSSEAQGRIVGAK